MAFLSLLMNEERTLDIGLPEISGSVYVIQSNQRLTTNRFNIWPRPYQMIGKASLNNRKPRLFFGDNNTYFENSNKAQLVHSTADIS